MFKRFGQTARRSIYFARAEALASGAREIETQHLLLGILRENDGTTRALFDAFAVDPARLRAQWPLRADGISSSDEIRLDDETRAILAGVASEAERSTAEVQPIHILIGLLRATESAAAKSLASVGMSGPSAIEIATKLALSQ